MPNLPTFTAGLLLTCLSLLSPMGNVRAAASVVVPEEAPASSVLSASARIAYTAAFEQHVALTYARAGLTAAGVPLDPLAVKGRRPHLLDPRRSGRSGTGGLRLLAALPAGRALPGLGRERLLPFAGASHAAARRRAPRPPPPQRQRPPPEAALLRCRTRLCGRSLHA